MERVRWTDERLDERMAAMDEKFDLLFAETRALREEMRRGFLGLRGEMQAGFADLRRDLSAFQRHVTLIIAAFAVGLLGLLGAGQL